MFNIKEKGLTGFGLKYLALVFMVLDHIHYFFEFTGKVPIAFSWIGRLAAPLFLFCFVEGFIHTHDRKKYFLKIYLISVVMGVIQSGFYFVLSPAVRGELVELTKSEFDIVTLLFKNKGQVFSKGQIYEIIYGYDKDGDESAITEHIKNLRRKLKQYEIEPIETVWGVGYRWKKQM